VKPSNNSQGGIIEVEAPINLSNLMLIDPKTSKPTRVGRKNVDGKSTRVSVKTGEIIK
jgi:large subunit ribosomal protein L24